MEKNYKYLVDMYKDPYFPTFLVDKIKVLIQEVEQFIEEGNKSLEEIQNKLDNMTLSINALEEEFEESNSELETCAREAIADTVYNMLKHYNIDIDIETAIQERSW
ncbi:DUF5713 family protein [Anaerophilus nitritogenes]|uniref:DUF5713 family protein n=1 Tax=Anaerophilus nitritogenes TaxID=2498136 RepID=UPI00101DA669|nr:DUF5713 family protein [Anaerophilus nitritogenes]